MTNFEIYKIQNKYLVGRKESNGYVIEARTAYRSYVFHEHEDIKKKKESK